MKTTTLALFALIGSAAAGKPQLSINVQNGDFADIGGLDPSVTWSSSTTSGDIDIEYGIDAAALPTTDIASLPKTIWGKASTNIDAWGVSVRGEFEGTDFSKAALEIDATNPDAFDLHVDASAGDGFTVHKIEATKTIDSDGAELTINPRYNVETAEADVVVTYSKDGAEVELTASQDAQSVAISYDVNDDATIEVSASIEAQSATIAYQVDEDNKVSPTVTSGGAVSVEWERSLGDDSAVTTTLKPSESVDVEWNDGAWTANVNMPLDGTDITGTNVSIKREVNF